VPDRIGDSWIELPWAELIDGIVKDADVVPTPVNMLPPEYSIEVNNRKTLEGELRRSVIAPNCTQVFWKKTWK